MNYKTSIHNFEFVHGFNSEQRFHETLHSRMMLQRHVRCTLVQRRMAIKSYLINNIISLVKNDVLLSMHYLTLATLFDHAVPVHNCEMFCFYRYDARAAQIWVNLNRHIPRLTRKKRWQSLYIFLKSQCMNVRCFESA